MGTDVEGAASFSSLPKVVSNEGDPQTGAAEAPNTGSLHPASGAGEDSEFKRILDELRSLRKDRIDMRGELEKLAQEEKRLRDTLVAGGISVPMGHITASGNVFANNGNLSGSQEGKTGSMPHSHPPSQPYLHQVHPHAHAQAPHHPSHHLRHQYYAPTSELSGSKLGGTSLEQMRLMNGDERDRENRRTNTAAPMLPSYLSNTSPSPQPSAMHHGISSFPSGGLSNVAPTHATMSSMWGQLSQFNVFEDNFSRVPSHHTAVHHAHAQPSQQPHHARHLQHRHPHHTRHNHLHQQFPVSGLHPAAYGIQYPGSAQPQLVPSYTPGNKTAFGTALGHVTASAAPGPSTSEWALNPSGNVISSHPDAAAGMVPFHSTHPRIGFESHAPPPPIVSPSAYTQQQQVGADAAARTDVNPSSTYPSQLPCFLEDRDMGGYSQPYPPSKSSHNSGGGTYPTEHSSNTPTPLPVPLSPFAHHPFPPQSIFGSAPLHHHLSPYPNMPVTQGMPFGSGTSGAESSHPSPGVSALRSPDLTPHAQAASIAAVHHTFPSTSVSNTLNSTNNNNGGLGGNNKRGVALQGTVFDTSGDVSSTALHGTCGVDPTYPAMTGGSPHSVLGHIVLLAQDQNGCRMLQRTFAESTKSERFLILEEIRAAGALGRLMMDPFANFFVQKMCESASDEELTELLRMSQAELASVCFSVYGTRTVQKMIETLRTQENVELFQEGLRPHVVALVKDTNSNHVIQKCLCTFSHPNKQFIFDAMVPRLVEVATNRYGCCVLQRCLDHGDTEQRNALIPHIIRYALHLVQDSFGNYLIQYLVNMKDSNLIAKIIRPLLHRIAPLSCSKYASNVIEKCLRVAPEGIRQLLVDELTYPEHVPQLLRDGFANYVLQTALVVASPLQFEQLAEAIQPSLHLVRNLPHGKKLESKLTRRQQQVSLAQKKGVSGGSVTRSDARGAEAESASNPKGSRKKRVSPQ